MYEIYCKLRDEKGCKDADVASLLFLIGRMGEVNQKMRSLLR